jgi:hypothetical protein
VTNISPDVIDIGTTVGPQGFLDFKVKDPTGKGIETDVSYGGLFSPITFEPRPYLLKSGEAYIDNVRGLITVPKEKKQAAGTYNVKAVFKFQGKIYESKEVDVKWPGEK